MLPMFRRIVSPHACSSGGTCLEMAVATCRGTRVRAQKFAVVTVRSGKHRHHVTSVSAFYLWAVEEEGRVGRGPGRGSQDSGQDLQWEGPTASTHFDVWPVLLYIVLPSGCRVTGPRSPTARRENWLRKRISGVQGPLGLWSPAVVNLEMYRWSPKYKVRIYLKVFKF
jgi:hypothetical protein